MAVPLDITNSAVSGFCDAEAELQASHARAQRKASDRARAGNRFNGM